MEDFCVFPWTDDDSSGYISSLAWHSSTAACSGLQLPLSGSTRSNIRHDPVFTVHYLRPFSPRYTQSQPVQGPGPVGTTKYSLRFTVVREPAPFQLRYSELEVRELGHLGNKSISDLNLFLLTAHGRSEQCQAPQQQQRRRFQQWGPLLAR